MLENNKKTVKIAFKNFPLPSIHNMAIPAALAGIAAHNQGKFWQLHDAIFAMDTITSEKITAAAQKIGIDMVRFNADRNSEITRQHLEKDMRDASEAQVTGTPSLFINGRRVSDRSPKALQKMIDQELIKSQSKWKKPTVKSD